MGLSRRFLNMIVHSHEAATRTLRRIDLKRLELFSTPPLPPPAPIQLPATKILEFGHILRGAGDPCNLACYPFGQRKVLSTDHAGRSLLYDASTRDVQTMPDFHKPKLRGCISLFVPSGNDHGEDHHEEEGDVDAKEEREGGGSGSLYFMVRRLREMKRFDIAAGQPSMDFEVLVYGNGKTNSHYELLPLPPFVLEPIHQNEYSPGICSYAVIGGGSHICVSVDGRGTYTLDTVSHSWDKVGDWTLPFHGKVEYEPELKLWFGLSGDAQHLAAADLSTLDAHSPPQLAASHSWEEFQPPEGWTEQEIEIDDVQLVNLGSGRFCIARFFSNYVGDDSVPCFVVLTGVEVSTRVLADGEVKLEMIPHKSLCHHKSSGDGTIIEQLF